MTDEWITTGEAAGILGIKRRWFLRKYLSPPIISTRPYSDSKYRMSHPEVKKRRIYVLRSEIEEIATDHNIARMDPRKVWKRATKERIVRALLAAQEECVRLAKLLEERDADRS